MSSLQICSSQRPSKAYVPIKFVQVIPDKDRIPTKLVVEGVPTKLSGLHTIVKLGVFTHTIFPFGLRSYLFILFSSRKLNTLLSNDNLSFQRKVNFLFASCLLCTVLTKALYYKC